MAALSADLNMSVVGSPTTVPLPAIGADIFYRGAVIYIDPTGYVTPAGSAGARIAGICPRQQTTTAAGQLVEILVFGFVWLPIATTLALADVGSVLYMDSADQTDNPVDALNQEDTAIAASDAMVGRILTLGPTAGSSPTQMLIHVGGNYTGSLGTGAGTWS